MIKGTLKSYLNRCRCCLQKFELDEKYSPITDFFEIQFYAFTHVELKKHELLSSHLCEYCHCELMRFSAFKKELIEKQQQLYKLLENYNEQQKVRTNIRKHKSITESDSDEVEILEDENDDLERNITEISEVTDINDVDEEEEEEISENGSNESFDRDTASEMEVSENEEKEEKQPKLPRTKNTTFVCDYCNVNFRAKQGLSRHIQIHLNKEHRGDFRCDIDRCDYRTYSKNAINKHKIRFHKNASEDVPAEKSNKRSPCFCGVNCKSPSSLLYHIKRYHDGFIKCAYGCNSNHKTTGDWIRHIRDKHQDREKECLEIGKVLKSIIPSSIAKVKNKFECELCYRIFTTTSLLNAHIASAHNEERGLECSVCSKKFNDFSHLKEHLKKVHKQDCKPYVCWCDESFETKLELKIHKKKLHEEVMKDVEPFQQPVRPISKFSCPCKKKFFNIDSLKIHRKNCKAYATAKEKESLKCGFECPVCEKILSCQANLLRHQKALQHFSEEQLKDLKYSCKSCSQRFFTKVSYERHLKNKPECKI